MNQSRIRFTEVDETPASRTRIANLSTVTKPFDMMSLQVVAVLRNCRAGTAAGPLLRSLSTLVKRVELGGQKSTDDSDYDLTNVY